MWKKFKSLLYTASVIDKLIALVPPALVAVVTGWLGLAFDSLPKSVLMVLMCAALALTAGGIALLLWVKDRIQDPPKLRRKRTLLGRLCANTYQLTETYAGAQSPIAEALNEIRLVYAEDAEVQKQLARLLNDDYAGRDIPDLIREMAKVAEMPVDHEAFAKPLVPRLVQPKSNKEESDDPATASE